ncbi:DUF2306 domain-containing protein [Panacibacter ginsenosidivorans]|uniref:DUF2306 domain-containing protein n=1 Tax=Panacibacter ginsenosidivorans TaxID=1813871 RepID=A0A5B8V4S5_9BACT|nr:DUF2306 domain-containing protein [Panacibacter ginsenosidivorans]QEC66487.1 DUF2306 domain-containing protein [Panacibacter ginsenosidivorans]
MTTKIIGYLGWAIVLSVSFYFIYNNVFNYFSYDKTHYSDGGFWPSYAPFLLAHVVFGMIALLLGPLQFIPAIRKKYVKTHHTIGKIYLISILIAASASLYLSIDKVIITEKGINFGTGLMGLAIAWLLTSGMAYWSIRHRNFAQHREWMVRSFVVTTAFASFRLFNNTLIDDFHIDPNATSDVMSWACWAFPLLITEVVLQAIKIRRGYAALSKKQQQNVVKAV